MLQIIHSNHNLLNAEHLIHVRIFHVRAPCDMRCCAVWVSGQRLRHIQCMDKLAANHINSEWKKDVCSKLATHIAFHIATTNIRFYLMNK